MKNKEYVDFDKQKKYILNVLRFYGYKDISFYDRIKGDSSWVIACNFLYEYKVVCELEKLSFISYFIIFS